MAVGTQRPQSRSLPATHARIPSRPPLLRLDRASLAVAVGVALAVFTLSWYRHATFRSSTLDLAVFDQAIWKLAHLEAPLVTTIGWNAFADHVSPVLLLFVPLYWVASTPLWLFGAQALALGAGYLALRPALEAVGAPRRAIPALSFAYLVSPLLWNAALFDFHPTTLAVPFLLAAITCALTDRRGGLAACCAALLFLRDDLGPAVTVLALIGFRSPASSRHHGRRFRLALAGAGASWMVAGSALGKALGADRHWDYHYGYVASSPAVAILHPLRSTWRLGEGILQGDNLFLTLAFLAPLAFLPLLKPKWALATGALMLPLLASAGDQFHSPRYHYGAVVLPFLVVASGGALRRVPARLAESHIAGLLVAGSALAFLMLGPPATRALSTDAPDPASARAALALVGPDEGVVAGTVLGPHLAERDQLLMYPYPFVDFQAEIPLSATARRADGATASTIDVVLIVAPRNPTGRQVLDAFLRSPNARDFHLQRQIGEVLVYRRRGP